MRDGELPPLRLVAVPGPGPADPSDLLLIRTGEAFLVTYWELSLLTAAAASVRDSLARRSPHYAPADAPPQAETLH